MKGRRRRELSPTNVILSPLLVLPPTSPNPPNPQKGKKNKKNKGEDFDADAEVRMHNRGALFLRIIPLSTSL
jgi:hypothetical protein